MGGPQTRRISFQANMILHRNSRGLQGKISAQGKIPAQVGPDTVLQRTKGEPLYNFRILAHSLYREITLSKSSRDPQGLHRVLEASFRLMCNDPMLIYPSPPERVLRPFMPIPYAYAYFLNLLY